MRVRDLWRRAARRALQFGRLPALHAEKRRSLAAVRAVEQHLQRGLFVPSGPTLWRHWSAPLPEHLLRTKGYAARATQLTDPFVRRVLSRCAVLRSPLALARRLLLPLVPPYLYWSRGGGPATAAVGTTDGAAVLIAPEPGHVIRAHPTTVFDLGYEKRRHVFEKHLRCAPFEVLEGGTAIREDFVTGRFFPDLSLAARLEVTRTMIAGFESLTRAAGAGGSRNLLLPMHEALQGARPPEELAELLRGALSPQAARRWPRVPAGTDPRPKNIVIVDDLVPVFIDLGSLLLAPFFYYPAGFIANAGRGVREAFLRGELDSEFAALFAAAGADYPADAQGRLGLLAIPVLIASYKECSPNGVLDLPRFNQTIGRRWTATFDS